MLFVFNFPVPGAGLSLKLMAFVSRFILAFQITRTKTFLHIVFGDKFKLLRTLE